MWTGTRLRSAGSRRSSPSSGRSRGGSATTTRTRRRPPRERALLLGHSSSSSGLRRCTAPTHSARPRTRSRGWRARRSSPTSAAGGSAALARVAPSAGGRAIQASTGESPLAQATTERPYLRPRPVQREAQDLQRVLPPRQQAAALRVRPAVQVAVGLDVQAPGRRDGREISDRIGETPESRARMTGSCFPSADIDEIRMRRFSMATSGEFQWPPLGKNRWPLTQRLLYVRRRETCPCLKARFGRCLSESSRRPAAPSCDTTGRTDL